MNKLAEPANAIQRPSGNHAADTQVASAIELAKTGRRAEAIAVFRRVLAGRPNHALAHFNLGVALAEEKKFVDALASFKDAIRCQPNYAEAHCGLGNVLGEMGRDEEATEAFRAAIRHKPDFVDALHNLGVALTGLKRGEEAAIFLRQVIRLRPDFAEAHNSLGLAHMERGDFAAAEACFEEALRLNPRGVDAHTNLGSVFKEQGRLREALVCYDIALGFEPEAVTTHWNRSLAWLQLGDFQRGWLEYEWRWKRKGTLPPPYPQPRWDGSPLTGRTILLHVEQGLGDMLQFVRFVPLVKNLGGTVVVAAPLPIVGLLASCPGVDKTVTENQELPFFDVHAPFMSLPGILGTTLENIPANVPYLTAEEEKIKHWRKQLEAIPGFKVGIAWQGNPRHKWDKHRSFPLALFGSMARMNGVTLVSLQKGPGSEQIPLMKKQFPLLDFGADLVDFTDTAALIQCLDLVISCDSAVAHLAGSLGAKVWVALSAIVDWRWLFDREDSPWYPTMRLFRQKKLGDWKQVVRRMAKELARLTSRNSERHLPPLAESGTLTCRQVN